MAAESDAPILRAINLTKQYREGDRVRKVLERTDLTLWPGELVVLLGRSGSGKSTLLNLAGGIDLPDAGSVWLDQVEVTALSENDRTRFRRSRIGFVFQALNLIPTLTVEENILLPLELNNRMDKLNRLRVLDLLDRVELKHRSTSFPDRLSGGEQQRVAIVRALSHEPSLILADEPTGNLDTETGQQVMDLFDTLIRSQNRSVLIATHDRSLCSIADRVLTLRKGELQTLTNAELPGHEE